MEIRTNPTTPGLVSRVGGPTSLDWTTHATHNDVCTSTSSTTAAAAAVAVPATKADISSTARKDDASEWILSKSEFATATATATASSSINTRLFVRCGTGLSPPPPPPPPPPQQHNDQDSTLDVAYGADDQTVEAQHVVNSFSAIRRQSRSGKQCRCRYAGRY
jgi:hypothetical protein